MHVMWFIASRPTPAKREACKNQQTGKQGHSFIGPPVMIPFINIVTFIAQCLTAAYTHPVKRYKPTNQAGMLKHNFPTSIEQMH